eukprot:1142622-Pelagomonas_calceolata.AAC.2
MPCNQETITPDMLFIYRGLAGEREGWALGGGEGGIKFGHPGVWLTALQDPLVKTSLTYSERAFLRRARPPGGLTALMSQHVSFSLFQAGKVSSAYLVFLFGGMALSGLKKEHISKHIVQEHVQQDKQGNLPCN